LKPNILAYLYFIFIDGKDWVKLNILAQIAKNPGSTFWTRRMIQPPTEEIGLWSKAGRPSHFDDLAVSGGGR
jgi:hypothetical protein